MKWPFWGFAALVAISLGLWAWSTPDASGPAWDDDGPHGHSTLVAALSEEGPVRVLESSIAALPADAGAGDLLLLSSAQRPPTTMETVRLRGFVADGGTLVMAIDGERGAQWAAAFDVQVLPLPARLPPYVGGDCAPVVVTDEHSVCLPSPSVLRDLEERASKPLAAVLRSSVDMFVDLDGDGVLTKNDLGPQMFPVGASFGHGNGVVWLLADGDVWRNDVLAAHPGNLAVVLQWAGEGTRYVDSSTADRNVLQHGAQTAVSTLGAPTLTAVVALVLGAGAVAAGAYAVPRALVWRPHEGPGDREDDGLEEQARAARERARHQANK